MDKVIAGLKRQTWITVVQVLVLLAVVVLLAAGCGKSKDDAIEECVHDRLALVQSDSTLSQAFDAMTGDQMTTYLAGLHDRCATEVDG